MVKIESKTAIFGGLGIALIVGAAFFLVREVRSAGQDLFEALPTIDEGLRDSIGDIASSVSSLTGNISDLTGGLLQFQQDAAANLAQFQADAAANLNSLTDFFGNLFQTQQDNLSQLAGQTVQSGDSTIFIPEDTTINPDGTVSGSPPLLDLSDEAKAAAQAALDANKILNETFQDPFFGDAELVKAVNEQAFKDAQNQTQVIIPEPIIDNEFFENPNIDNDDNFSVGGPGTGSGGVVGTIFENPIDTLSEAIALGLTASQAADFLNEFSGILPSELSGIDPDISNITANIDGENVQVQNVSVSDLDAQEKISACTTCGLFGLNCEICNA